MSAAALTICGTFPEGRHLHNSRPDLKKKPSLRIGEALDGGDG